MTDHYFSTTPAGPQDRQLIEVQVWGLRLSLLTAGGVFSAGRLDRGTAVLLREAAPPQRPGTFLDLGCGYGVIACALAAAVPRAQVWAVDVNERALELCAANAATLGWADRVRPVPPDDVPDDVVFDEIWSNPPIRIGKTALHDLLARWLPRLAPHGRGLLVVGRNLGADSLQRWLATSLGLDCRRMGSAKGFRVLEIRRPEPLSRPDTPPDGGS